MTVKAWLDEPLINSSQTSSSAILLFTNSLEIGNIGYHMIQVFWHCSIAKIIAIVSLLVWRRVLQPFLSYFISRALFFYIK